MSKKTGIKVELTYDVWNCDNPKSGMSKKEMASVLKHDIVDTIRNGKIGFERELPLIVNAPFMEFNTLHRNPYIKIELNENKVYEDDLTHDISYDGKIVVTVIWRV